jgi:hypothetical protein
MDEEGEGGGGSLTLTYEKMGTGGSLIQTFWCFLTPVHYAQGTH